MNLRDILLQKGKKQELAHFYIVEGGDQETLETFVHHFIRDYYKDVEGHKQSMANLMDHPDVYVLGNLTSTEDPEDSPFTVLESEQLGRFFEFKAVQSQRKFAVITEAHRINTIIANKWLKLLEEPQGKATIFLLNPRGQKLLDTIHSRAIHLRLKAPSELPHPEEWREFLSSVKKQGLASFLDEHVRGEKDLEFWIKELVHWEATQAEGAEAKSALEEWLKSYQEMDLFHQPAATKWTLFYSHLKQYVLPRLSH